MLGLLIAGDLAFLLLFFLLAIGVCTDPGFILTYDRSYAEVFQYVKQYWIVLLLLALAWQRRSACYPIFAGLFTFFLIDDYAELHERWGESLAAALHLPAKWMLQPHDFGELIVFASYAIIGFTTVLTGYRMAATRDRLVVWELFQLLVLFGVFAVGVDLLHALALPELISNSIGAIEDGGEMVVVSLLVWRLLIHATASITQQATHQQAVSESPAAEPARH